MAKTSLASAIAFLAGLSVAPASEPVTIGMMAPLSGSSAVLGQHMRDGARLALSALGGRIAGRSVAFILVDDESDPDLAIARARALLEREAADILTGVASLDMMAALSDSAIFVGAPAAASTIARRRCAASFFSMSGREDRTHQIMGAYAARQGYARVALIALDDPSGPSAVAAFQRGYGVEVADIALAKPDDADFANTLAGIASSAIDALYAVAPGRAGVTLVRQFHEAALKDAIVFLSASTIDETMSQAAGDAALDLVGAAHWAPDLDNAANRAFVAGFENAFGYPPSIHAARSYDAINLIASGVETVDGDLADADALRAALADADFNSVRGAFAFGADQFPIQDLHLVAAVERADGAFVTSARSMLARAGNQSDSAACSAN